MIATLYKLLAQLNYMYVDLKESQVLNCFQLAVTGLLTTLVNYCCVNYNSI